MYPGWFQHSLCAQSALMTFGLHSSHMPSARDYYYPHVINEETGRVICLNVVS